jgi:hypothetical protein
MDLDHPGSDRQKRPHIAVESGDCSRPRKRLVSEDSAHTSAHTALGPGCPGNSTPPSLLGSESDYGGLLDVPFSGAQSSLMSCTPDEPSPEEAREDPPDEVAIQNRPEPEVCFGMVN